MTIPDWKLERLILGELDKEELAALERALAEDQEARERFEKLRRENEATLSAHPPARVVAEIERRRARGAERPRTPWRFAMPVAGLAVATALVLITISPPPSVIIGEGPDTTRIKGAEPYLIIHRRAGDGSDRLASGAQARAGDVLQVSYAALGRRHGLIFSIDGRGALTVHYPPAMGGSTELETRDGTVALPLAYELDDAPDFERFFFVTSAQPIDADGVLSSARAFALDHAHREHGTFALPPGLEISSVLLEKGGS